MCRKSSWALAGRDITAALVQRAATQVGLTAMAVEAGAARRHGLSESLGQGEGFAECGC